MNHELIQVEQPAIAQLEALGYTHVPTAQLAPGAGERDSYRDVVLEGRLRSAIQRINPWISEDNLSKVIRDLTVVGAASLLEANQWFYEGMVRYMSHEQDLGSGRKGQTVKIIDFDEPANNDFIVTSQFRVQGPNEVIIPDIVIFVNGLPLAVVECKSPTITNPMATGIDQLLRYTNCRHPLSSEGAERLFWYNQILVSTYSDQARMGTISSLPEHYLEWKDPYPLPLAELGEHPSSQQVLLTGMFRKENLLDLIQSFIVFETVDGRTIKKVARYQQYRAVHKAIERLKTPGTRRDRGGVVWHTQGSGKSLTMVFTAARIRRDPDLRDYKLVFVTDRTTLDVQLTNTFRRCQDETVHHAGSVAEMKALLRKDSSDLVTCMLQKFQEDEWGQAEELNTSPRIVLMVDEAHRGHYSTMGTAINVAAPNAAKIAFTGTPLIRTQQTTNEFGTYIDTYRIDEAVRDGATVQIVYEGRESRTKVTGNSLDRLFDVTFADKTDEERAEIRRRYGKEQAVLEAPKRIEMVCRDLLAHYEGHIQPNGFKAMIVTASRRAAVTYKETLDRLGAHESAVVISGMHNDDPDLAQYTNKAKVRDAIKRFADPTDDLCFVVVKDMLLTGFDVPACQVMYLDRRLVEHNLLQAIARVNRTRKNKFRGYIVDYYGLSDYLQEALEVFSKDDVAGALRPIKDELPKLERRHARVMGFFEGIDRSDVEACVLSLADEQRRSEFGIALKRFLEIMDVVMPHPLAAPYIADMKWLGMVQIRARNRFRPADPDILACGEKCRELIHEHVYSEGVDPMIPPLGVFDAQFPYHVQAMRSPRAQASEIEHAIKHHITVNIDRDPEYYRKLSERLEQILQAQHENWEGLVQQLLDFRETMEDEREAQAADLGMTDREYAFYNILRAEADATDSDTPVYTSEAQVIATNAILVALLEEATSIVDFFRKQDEQRRVQRKIKRALIASKLNLGADARNRVISRFMELARARF